MPRNMELTTTEKQALALITRHIDEHGVPPSQRWLAGQLGIYQNAVRHLLSSMKTKGFMREEKITATRLTLSAKGRKAVTP